MATTRLTESNILQKAKAFSGYTNRAWIFPWTLFAVFILFVIIEFAYSPFERGIGEYMAWTSNVRPESGEGWDFHREGHTAGQKLGEIAEEIQDRQSAGLNFSDWSELPGLLEKYRAFSLSPNRFLELYEKLPEKLQKEIITPIELLHVRTGGKWQRVFFIEDRKDVRVYLVDAKNVVLKQSNLKELFFRQWESLHKPYPGSLDSFSEFSGRSFPATLFFKVVEPAGPVKLSDMDVSWIAELSGKLNRVGVAANSENGLNKLGFEIERNDGVYTYMLWIDRKEAQLLFREMMDQFLLGEGL